MGDRTLCAGREWGGFLVPMQLSNVDFERLDKCCRISGEEAAKNQGLALVGFYYNTVDMISEFQFIVYVDAEIHTVVSLS